MTGPRRGHRRLRREPLDELRLGPARVDFTGPIMARLGMPAAGTRAARIAMVRRWGGRMLLAAALVFAIATGFLIHARHEQSQRPAGPSLPAAIRNDLDRHQHAITAAIQTIRQLQPRLPEQAAEPGPLRGPPGAALTREPSAATRPARGAERRDETPSPAPGPGPGPAFEPAGTPDPGPGSAQFPDPEHRGSGQA